MCTHNLSSTEREREKENEENVISHSHGCVFRVENPRSVYVFWVGKCWFDLSVFWLMNLRAKNFAPPKLKHINAHNATDFSAYLGELLHIFGEYTFAYKDHKILQNYSTADSVQ